MLSASALGVDRANTGQKGSLLVFPKIDVSAGRDTLVRIENSYSASVDVKCYWQNGTKHYSDIQFELTKFQPFVIIASQFFPQALGPVVGPVDRGELKCFAVNEDGSNEIRWNHLSGSAQVFDFETSSVHEYTAWAFRCLQDVGNGGDCGDSPGNLMLDGREYEKCPSTLTTGFSPTGAFGGLFGPSTLTVATCNQDLRQDRALLYTKLQFAVWREDETKFTGAYHCIDSWHETVLDEVQNNAQNFSQALLGNNARFAVRGVSSAVCPNPTSDAGLVGVIATSVFDDVAATTLVGYGAIKGHLSYDPAQTVTEFVYPARQ